MPTYEYECLSAHRHRFTRANVSVHDRNSPPPCPDCSHVGEELGIEVHMPATRVLFPEDADVKYRVGTEGLLQAKGLKHDDHALAPVRNRTMWGYGRANFGKNRQGQAKRG